MGSVALGLVAGLFVLSIYKGVLDERVRTVIDKEVSHLQLHHLKFKDDYDAKYIVNDQGKLLTHLRANTKILSFAVRTLGQGMIITGTGSSALQIVGVDVEPENKLSKLSTKVIQGTSLTGDKKNQVLIGKKLADKMHLKVNSKIVLTFTDGESNIVSAAFRIAGIYETTNGPRDERIAYVRRTDLNKLLSMDDQFHEVAILLKDDRVIDSVKTQLKKEFQMLKTESWSEVSPETKLMIDTTEQYSAIFMMIIMLALSFGIINTMLMAVLERTREMGMLMAVGMNRFRVFSMILTETTFLTICGAPVGIMLSWLIVLYYHHQGLDISSIGGKAMTQFGFAAIMYPAFPWEKIVRQLTVVLGAAMLSSLIPAIYAIKLRPVVALQK
jgi:ABC-type lipoprotein release transport system permease subunit